MLFFKIGHCCCCKAFVVLEIDCGIVPDLVLGTFQIVECDELNFQEVDRSKDIFVYKVRLVVFDNYKAPLKSGIFQINQDQQH